METLTRCKLKNELICDVIIASNTGQCEIITDRSNFS